jgi:hypothetical protein
MFNYVGSEGALALFSNGYLGVSIDTNVDLIVEVNPLSSFENRSWAETVEVPESTMQLASMVLDTKPLVASGSRLYTIPKGVQEEAKKALEWRKEEKRGGTPVGLNTARILAKGGQVGIKKIRHIAKYFPRHEVDKKGKGWAPGEDNFPSNGRIAWALWGGDAGWRWSKDIVERQDDSELALIAAGNYDDFDITQEHVSGVDAFKEAYKLDNDYGPEFLARVRMDGSGIDRLYKIEVDGSVYVWDDGVWDTLGHVDGDIYTYDVALDDAYDTVEKTHVMVDPSSAMIISAFMQERPHDCVRIEEIEPEEAILISNAMADLDYDMVDLVLTAAGDAMSDPRKDGNYTPEERAQNTKAQPRDARGLFVKVGARTVVGGDPVRGQGTITGINSDKGTVSVRLDSGKNVEVNPKYTRAPGAGDGLKSGQNLVPSTEQRPLDLSGIVGEPRTPNDQPKAHLPGTMKPLTDKEIQTMVSDFPKYVQNMRSSYKPRDAADKARVKKDWGKDVGSDFSVVAAAKEAVQTPKTSDVAPKYLAIVSPDDPRAVMDVIAIVPDTAKTANPITYKREDKQWVRDDQILMDLKSATPPPVVKLEEEVLNDVLLQVDDMKAVQASGVYASLIQFWARDVESALVAAGGLDRNRGNAEELRQYWTRGKGAAKIRWGTPGDWTRCVRQLSKYMGPRAKGYCQLRHKEATGVYTGSRLNPGRRKRNLFTSQDQFTQAVIDQSALVARANNAIEKITLVADGSPAAGAKFIIPLVIPEGKESGDGRSFVKDALEVRELPLPLMWQIKTGDGHMGSVVVGRIDYMERIENGIGNAYGVFDTGAYGREAERLVRNGFIRGVSADLDQFEAKEDKEKDNSEDDSEEVGKTKLTINHARVMAATIVAKPAFQECMIYIEDDIPQLSQE